AVQAPAAAAPVAAPAPPAPEPRGPLAEPRERFFVPFAPYLIDERTAVKQPGWICRETLEPLWTLAEREIIGEALVPWTGAALAGAHATASELEAAVATMRGTTFAELQRRIRDGRDDPKARMRLAMRLGGDAAYEDLVDMLALRDRLPRLERILGRLPATIGATEIAEKLAAEPIAAHLDACPDDAPWLAAAVAGRVATPATLFRIAVLAAGSDDVADIRDTPAADFVDVGLGVGERAILRFETLWAERADLADLVGEFRRFHEVVRGATTVVLVHNDSRWRTRLVDLRRTMSQLIGRLLDDALPVLRTALRPAPDVDPAPADADDAVRVVAVFTAARRHKEALAVNELVARLGASIDQAIDVYGREIIERLRKARGERRAALTQLSDSLLKMAELAHGEEYAVLLRKSRDIALGRVGTP
ncbi:hypothetical protein, partial [Oharaeibacter diazotrophicus]